VTVKPIPVERLKGVLLWLSSAAGKRGENTHCHEPWILRLDASLRSLLLAAATAVTAKAIVPAILSRYWGSPTFNSDYSLLTRPNWIVGST